MNLKYSILLVSIITFLKVNFLQAQVVPDTIKAGEQDDRYYKGMLDLINIKLDFHSESESFDLKVEQEDGSVYENDIRPNVALVSRLSLSYAFISFSFSYVPKIIPGNNDNDLKGKTKGFGLGMNMNFSKWQQGFHYSKVQGFYLENTSDFIPNWEKDKDAYIQFPDLKVISFKGSTQYKFNQNFSQNAISSQTEVQLKSAGSFIPGFRYSYYIIDNLSNDPSQQTSQRSQAIEAIAYAGYYHTFVLHENLYLTAGISPGFGFNYTHLLTRLPEEYVYTDFTEWVARINARAAIGFNFTHLFGGGEIRGYQSYRADNSPAVTITTTGLFFQVFIGYRFNAPAFVKKGMKDIEEKKPF